MPNFEISSRHVNKSQKKQALYYMYYSVAPKEQRMALAPLWPPYWTAQLRPLPLELSAGCWLTPLCPEPRVSPAVKQASVGLCPVLPQGEPRAGFPTPGSSREDGESAPQCLPAVSYGPAFSRSNRSVCPTAFCQQLQKSNSTYFFPQ